MVLVSRLADAYRSQAQELIAVWGRRRGRRDAMAAVVVFLVVLPFFASLTPAAFANGDPAVYLEQIEQRDFSGRTVHLGYYWIGSLYSLFVPELTPYSFNLLHAIFGAGTIVWVFLLAAGLSGRMFCGLAASLVAALNSLVLENSVSSEVYIPQCFFLLLSVILWLSNRIVPAALALAMSTLITPSALFAVPALVVLRPRARPVLVLIATTALVVSVALTGSWSDYLFGARGLLTSVGRAINPLDASLKEAFELTRGFFVLLPFAFLGTYSAIRRHPDCVLGLSILVLWAVSFVFGERFPDVPIQLPTYLLLCVACGVNLSLSLEPANEPSARRWPPRLFLLLLSCAPILLLQFARTFFSTLAELSQFLLPGSFVLMFFGGLLLLKVGVLRQAGRYALALFALATVTTGVFSITSVRNVTGKMTAFRTNIEQVGKLASEDYRVVADWSAGILFEHYLFGRSYTGRWLNIEGVRPGPGNEDNQTRQRYVQDVREGREIWLLNRDDELLSQLEEAGYLVRRVGDFYVAAITPPDSWGPQSEPRPGSDGLQ